jgi:hypothetical protein
MPMMVIRQRIDCDRLAARAQLSNAKVWIIKCSTETEIVAAG